MLDGYLAAETGVLTHMTTEPDHRIKDQGSVGSPNRSRRTEPPPTLCNAAPTDTYVDVVLDLYPGDVLVILHPTEEAITKGIVNVIVTTFWRD